MMNDLVKDWKDHPVTQHMLDILRIERGEMLESILRSPNKDHSCGLVFGMDVAISLITTLDQVSFDKGV
jgi:hypothetical protein